MNVAQCLELLTHTTDENFEDFFRVLFDAGVTESTCDAGNECSVPGKSSSSFSRVKLILTSCLWHAVRSPELIHLGLFTCNIPSHGRDGLAQLSLEKSIYGTAVYPCDARHVTASDRVLRLGGGQARKCTGTRTRVTKFGKHPPMLLMHSSGLVSRASASAWHKPTQVSRARFCVGDIETSDLSAQRGCG